MPISAADVQQAIADGLTRRFSFTDAAPTGGVDGDWASPGPANSRGVYRRRAGVWEREVGQHTGDEIVSLLEAQVGAARVDVTAIKNLPSSSGIAFTSLGSVNVTFTNKAFFVHGGAIPTAATLIQVVCHLDRIRGSWIRNADLWRTIQTASVGSAATSANRIILDNYGFVGNLSIGRRAGDSILIQYDGGFVGLAAGAVEVFIA